MLSSTDATRAIAESIQSFDVEKVALASAAGRVLRQAACAERDQPPFDRVMMDGIAINFSSLEAGLRRFRIAATQHAGDPRRSLKDTADCIEVMTGAVLPQNSDCVIPVERLVVENGFASVEDEYETQQYRFIHKQASDYREGTEVLAPGNEISPMDIAVIASCGLEQVLVSRLPTVRIISTGNELVAAGQPIDDHQIRLSNGPALVALLQQQGFENCSHDHLADDVQVLTDRIGASLLEADILILSGGVSMGKADFVPQVLAELGVEKIFHKISQRPGKPMWFGLSATKRAVFALPGNPVSTLVCARQYVLPALHKASGRAPRAPELAELAETILFEAALTNFVPVRLHTRDDGVLIANPVSTNTSGDFAALSGTDGYIELERESSEFRAGSIVPLHRWDKP
jgi:molybdopterin molybdotransferase